MPEGKKGARGREKCPCHMQGCVMHELQTSWNPGPMEEPRGGPARTDGVVAVGVTAGRKEGDTQPSTDE